jgi:hypothetical protein
MSPDKAQQIGNDLACIARTLAELAKEIKAEYDFDHDADDEPLEEEPAAEVKHPDISEVRGLLAEKSRAGHTAEVQALLVKHGVKKLSEVPPAEYTALMEEARKLE